MVGSREIHPAKITVNNRANRADVQRARRESKGDDEHLPSLPRDARLQPTSVSVKRIGPNPSSRPWEVVLATGLSFTVLMNASLLFPDPFMPAAVAHAHAVELVSSDFLYGILLAGLLIWRPTHGQEVIIDINRGESLSGPSRLVELQL
jgi:hypothetical protein